METKKSYKLKYFFIVSLLSILLTSFISSSSFARISSKKLPEFSLGKSNAPVTMYVFASLACPHCKEDFNMILNSSNIKSKYIDSGKVRIVYVAYPVFGPFDTQAIALAYHSKNSEQFFKLVQLIFNNQKRWYQSSNHEKTILSYAELAGFSKKQINDFKKHDKYSKLITKDQKRLLKTYKIDGVPTIILSKTNKVPTNKSIKIVGTTSVDNLSQKIDMALKQ